MYVVTGATGNTGHVVAKNLLAKGAKVRAIGRSTERLQALVSLGAEAFTADLTDAPGLASAFTGANAVYLMVPPNLASSDFRAFQDRVVDAMVTAIRSAGVTYAVTLSSIGADKSENTGPVVGLYNMEQRLNQIDRLNVLHLRAGYFMENTLAQIGIIQEIGVALGPLRPDLELPMIATQDIGAAAADALLKLDFRRAQTRELLGARDLTMSEAAGMIGKAIAKPELQYSQAPQEQVRPALLALGMSPNGADLILKMSDALNSGYMRALEERSAANTTPTSYETFVKEEFLPRYEGKPAAA